MEKIYSLYMHTCPNGKRYIGITCQKPKNRWNAGHGYKGCSYFSRAIEKYGWENIRHDVLATGLTKESAEWNEKRLIFILRTNCSEFGYNLDSGGFHGKEISDETRRKLSATRRGKPRSAETIRKMSESRRGEKHPLYGKHLSEETRRRISASGKGLKRSAETRKRISLAKMKPVFNLETGEIFESIDAAAAQYGVSRCCIGDCCAGRQKTSAGYHFSFVNDRILP